MLLHTHTLLRPPLKCGLLTPPSTHAPNTPSSTHPPSNTLLHTCKSLHSPDHAPTCIVRNPPNTPIHKSLPLPLHTHSMEPSAPLAFPFTPIHPSAKPTSLLSHHLHPFELLPPPTPAWTDLGTSSGKPLEQRTQPCLGKSMTHPPGSTSAPEWRAGRRLGGVSL